MKKRLWILILGVLVGLVVAAFVYSNVSEKAEAIIPQTAPQLDPSSVEEVMVFGASGAVGGGIYKALLDDPSVAKIHVVSLDTTPHIEQGIAQGKVALTLHDDYLDYQAIRPQLERVQHVYWAIGISATKVDKATYEKLHIDFPVAFIEYWLSLKGQHPRTFHLITGAGTSGSSWFHWARTKARARTRLLELTEGKELRVLTYRPIAVQPTGESIAAGKEAPPTMWTALAGAVQAETIGQSMIEVSTRGEELVTGSILENDTIEAFAAAYRRRNGRALP